MRRVLLSFAFAAMMLPASAGAQEWRMAPEYDVLLSTYDIGPDEIRLKAGAPIRLRFVNNSNQTLRFAAEGFFKDAQLRRRDNALVKGGEIAVPALSTRTVVVVPKPGRYRMSGGSLIHRMLGMNGKIIVE
jgi:plastocyanin